MKISVATLLAVIAGAAMGCGGSSSGGPTGPTAPPPAANTPPVATTTITITAAGVNPKRIVVAPGSRVTFVNNDTRPHEMHSDPHPNHGDCPAIDDVGFLAPGQSKQTGNLTVVRTCGYHDHALPDVVALQGEIVVQ